MNFVRLKWIVFLQIELIKARKTLIIIFLNTLGNEYPFLTIFVAIGLLSMYNNKYNVNMGGSYAYN